MADYRFTRVSINTDTNHTVYLRGGTGQAVGGEDNDHGIRVHTFIAKCRPVQDQQGVWHGPPITGNGNNGQPQYAITGQNPSGKTVDLGRYRCVRNGGDPWTPTQDTPCTFEFVQKP